MIQVLTERIGEVDRLGLGDQDGLRVDLFLLRSLVLVLKKGMERGRRPLRPGRQLTLLEVLVLGVSVRHVVVLLPALATAAVAWNRQIRCVLCTALLCLRN